MLLTHQLMPIAVSERNEKELLLHSYEKGEEIPLLEPGCWQVYRGVVQLSRINQKGQEVILGWATANNCFGNWLDHSPSSSYRAQALSDVYIRWFSPTVIEKYPSLAHMLLTQLSLRLIRAEQLLTVTGLRRVEDRLWQLLLLLAEEMGQSTLEGTRLTVRFTHQNLANVICTTRVTITRILGDFQCRGLIAFDKNRHLIIKKAQ
ncbi:Crp/Fnr family transcriptional regulator [Pleurocapsales cyanobacterium LEGE 06147]|nr:Crp/Fnr family transcriptional regulator [Pleurocapsales cyanobacterium LEGE 06147]